MVLCGIKSERCSLVSLAKPGSGRTQKVPREVPAASFLLAVQLTAVAPSEIPQKLRMILLTLEALLAMELVD